MSYTPTTWAAGDTVTAAKLNKLENGVANAGSSVLIVNVTQSGDTYTCDKTAGEMYAAAQNGVVVFHQVDTLANVTMCNNLKKYKYESGTYLFVSQTGDEFVASASTDYPSAASGK